MKRPIFFILFCFFSYNIFSQHLSLENYIVKEKKSNWKKETFFLGQRKTEKEFQNLKNNYQIQEIGDYDGWKNTIKVYNDNIDLYFTKNDIYKLVEIRIKTDNYCLVNTPIQVGNLIDDIIKKYPDVFSSYNSIDQYYFTELEDYTQEFEDVSFLNISLSVNEGRVNEILLYYSFTI